jgi:S1-C subfamily serine protease
MNTLIATMARNRTPALASPSRSTASRRFCRTYTKYGRVRRPSLGIASLAIGPDLAEQIGLPADYGVLVQKVVPGGAAERAGLRGGTQQAYLGNTPIYLGGDLIVAIDKTG